MPNRHSPTLHSNVFDAANEGYARTIMLLFRDVRMIAGCKLQLLIISSLEQVMSRSGLVSLLAAASKTPTSALLTTVLADHL